MLFRSDAGKTATEKDRKGNMGLEVAAARALGEVTAPALMPKVLAALGEARSAKDATVQREVKKAIARLQRGKP